MWFNNTTTQDMTYRPTKRDQHDRDVEALSSLGRQSQEAILQGILNYVLLLWPNCGRNSAVILTMTEIDEKKIMNEIRSIQSNLENKYVY